MIVHNLHYIVKFLNFFLGPNERSVSWREGSCVSHLPALLTHSTEVPV